MDRKLWLLALGMVVAAPAAAQELRMVRDNGGYGQFGLGWGNFTFTCGAGCPGASLSSSHGVFMLGRQFGGRLRVELGGHGQVNNKADGTNSLLVGTAGVSVYLVGNLYVRGGAAYLAPTGTDSAGTEYKGTGVGFLAGAGYELFVGNRIALTLYAHMLSGNVSRVTAGGTAATPADGKLSAVNFGISIGRSARQPYLCITSTGERVRWNKRVDPRFRSCLDAVGRRIGVRLP